MIKQIIIFIFFLTQTVFLFGQKKENVFIKGVKDTIITLKKIKDSATVINVSGQVNRNGETAIILWGEGFPYSYTYTSCKFNQQLPFVKNKKILDRIKVGTKLTIISIEHTDGWTKKKTFFNGITYEVVK